MRKGIIGVLTAILAIVLLLTLGIPYVMGIWVQKAYPRLIMQLVNNNPNASVKILNYQRGWFSSIANAEVNINSPWLSWPNASNKPLGSSATTFNVTERIYHGLVIFAPIQQQGSRLLFARAFLMTNVQNPNISFQSGTTWSMAGNLLTRLTAGKMQFGNQKQHVQLSNLQGDIEYGDRAKSKKLNMHADTLQLAQSNLVQMPWQLLLQNVHFQGNFYRQQNLWYGSRSIQVNKLVASNPQYSPITITQLATSMKQIPQKDTTSILMNMNADQLAKQNLSVNKVLLSLQVKNLNTAAFSRLVQHSSQTQGQILSAADLVAQLYSPVYNLLMSGFSIDLNPLSFNTPHGPANLVAHIEFPKQGGDASVAFLARNSQLSAHLELPRNWLMDRLINYFQNNKSPQAVPVQSSPLPQPQNPTIAVAADPSQTPLAMAQMQIEKWMSEKWLVAKGANFVTDLQYKNGQIYLNGQPYHFNNIP